MQMPNHLGKATSAACHPAFEMEVMGDFTHSCMSLHLVHPYTYLLTHIHERVLVTTSSTNWGLLRFT